MNCYPLAVSLPAEFEKARGFDVWLQVGRTNLKAHRVLNQLLASLDLTLAQHEILMMIRQYSGLSQKQLSEKLVVVKSNVSALLKKLEARGLVRRLSDPADSRNKRLSLTETGDELLCKSFSLQNQVVEAMTSALTDEDLQRTGEMMMRVNKALDQIQT